MPGTYGNMNFYRADSSLFVSYSTASEAVTLPVGTIGITLTATKKCWIKIGQPGETPTSAAPGAERTWVQRLFAINDGQTIDVAVPVSVDNSLVQIAVIRSTEDGVLDVIARKE